MRDRWGTQGTCAIAGHELAHHRVQISHVRAVRTARATLTPRVRGSVAITCSAAGAQAASIYHIYHIHQKRVLHVHPLRVTKNRIACGSRAGQGRGLMRATAGVPFPPGLRLLSRATAVGAVALQGAVGVLMQRVEQHAQALVCVLLAVVEEGGGAAIVAEGLHEGFGPDRVLVLSTPHVRAQAFEGHQQLAPAALLLLWLRNHRRPSCKV